MSYWFGRVGVLKGFDDIVLELILDINERVIFFKLFKS